MNSNLIYAWVPGLPHVLRPDLNKSYRDLNASMTVVGKKFNEHNVQRILYYSTQWLSVLGQSIQMRPKVKGLHVDENWYDIASLPFEFNIDLSLARNLEQGITKLGLQVRGVDYEGFPVDTGTIVADQLINPNKIPVGMHSCCVYSDYLETKSLGASAASALLDLPGTSAIVIVSGLSGRFFTSEIDFQEDHISSSDDALNRQLLQSIEHGDINQCQLVKDRLASEAKADMGLKALAFLDGAGAFTRSEALKTLGYGAIYGTGAAVMLKQ